MNPTLPMVNFVTEALGFVRRFGDSPSIAALAPKLISRDVDTGKRSITPALPMLHFDTVEFGLACLVWYGEFEYDRRVRLPLLSLGFGVFTDCELEALDFPFLFMARSMRAVSRA